MLPASVADAPFLAAAAGFASIGLAILLTFLGWWGYFVLFELLWNGQSPGKRLLGVRVVRADGQALGASTSLVRNLLRAIDVFLLIGVAVMLMRISWLLFGDRRLTMVVLALWLTSPLLAVLGTIMTFGIGYVLGRPPESDARGTG